MPKRQWTQAAMRILAEEERAELGLGRYQALDPYALASHHGIPVYPIDELVDGAPCEEAVRHFSVTRQHAWSAALVPVGRRRLIIENTTHPLARRRSSIAHELGHYLLEHEFDAVLLTEDGCRRYDSAKEKQATFLSGELLIPWKAAQRAAFNDKTNDEVAQAFGVSAQFAQMRMYGARVLARNALAKQAR